MVLAILNSNLFLFIQLIFFVLGISLLFFECEFCQYYIRVGDLAFCLSDFLKPIIKIYPKTSSQNGTNISILALGMIWVFRTVL